MFSVLDSGANGPGSGPGREHCVVFLDKTLLPRCLSPPRCINGYRRNVVQYQWWKSFYCPVVTENEVEEQLAKQRRLFSCSKPSQTANI